MAEKKQNEIPESTEEQTENIDQDKTESKTDSQHQSRIERFKNWYGARKKWTIPVSVLVVILLLILIPLTRYKIFGLFIKQDYSFQVVDAETSTPVSGADVSMDQKTVQTDNKGKAVIHEVSVGPHSLLVHKKYYSDVMAEETVPVLKQKSPKIIQFHAIGRQTKIKVQNLVSQAPVADVSIKVAGI